jgi:hypothetical protein
MNLFFFQSQPVEAKVIDNQELLIRHNYNLWVGPQHYGKDSEK